MASKNKIVVSDPIAQMSARLLERWGGFPGMPDGEDSSGKQKFRVVTAQELAKRAVDTATALHSELYARGNLYDDV